MGALINSEFKRIWLRKKTKILLILMIIWCVGWGFCMSLGGVGFYDPKTTTKLNSLNFSVLIMRDIHMFLAFVVFPMLFVDSLSGENISGAYRMIMTRPFKKWKLISAKWIAQALLILVFLLVLYVVNTILGNIYCPHASVTSFFKTNAEFNTVATLLYGLRFYLVEFFIIMTVLAVSSIICAIIPNSIVCIIAIVAALVGLVIKVKPFEFYLLINEYIFDTLGHTVSVNFYITLFASIAIGYLFSLVIWQNRDYRY